MLTTVVLRQCRPLTQQARAWFLPGGSVDEWIATIAMLPVEMHQASLYALPGDTEEQSNGLFVIAPSVAQTSPGVRAIAYVEFAPNLFIPADAQLWPPITPEECTLLQGLTLYHPARGIMQLHEDAMLRVGELLQPLPVGAENWSLARAGAPRNELLRSVRLSVELKIGEIFGPESSDIGTTPPEALPPAPDEAGSNRFLDAANFAQKAIAGALLGLTSLAPRVSGIGPTWINALEDWVMRNRDKLSAQLEGERHKELNRLLNSLRDDPDHGLKHAISLAALANRGKAPPSARLGKRDLNFDLKRVGGGAAADGWNIPSEIQAQLASRYRELALREAKLGRHRRAAYIYAELLGDLPSAAAMLKEGRHFPEAALLYRDRLNNPLAAADCFASAGMLNEAVAIFEHHHKWLELASLYEQLGFAAEATAALRKQVDVHL